MGVFLIPVMIVIALSPTPGPSDQTLADFSRFSKSIGRSVALVDREGTVREGVVSSATADSVTLGFVGGDRTFSQESVASAERLKDGVKDGFIKGALFGAIVGFFAGQGYDSEGGAVAGWFGSVAIYGLIGTAIDASQKHREPIYRVPAPALKVAVRF